MQVEKTCANCGVVFKHENYYERKYCSRTCANQANIKKRDQNNKWNNGVYFSNGRKMVKDIKSGKYIAEYRLIMESHLGRKLTPNEVVHHVDGDKTNNDINNLQIMTRVEHQRIHRIKPLIMINCANCGKEFGITGKQQKQGRKYCCHKCAIENIVQEKKQKGWPGNKDRVKLTAIPCPSCGKINNFRPCDLRKGAKYCSVECYRIAQKRGLVNA